MAEEHGPEAAPANHDMRTALMRCGINEGTANNTILQGITSPAILLLLTEKDIDTLVKDINRNTALAATGVSVPFMSIQYLKVFRFWADELERTGCDPDPSSFTDDDVDLYATRLAKYNMRKASADEAVVKKPPLFKKLADWKTFRPLLDNYLDATMGAAKISLTYLTREESTVPDDIDEAEYKSTRDFLHDATVHEGSHFEIDNERLFRDLKKLTVQGEGWTYIKKFESKKNGHGAYHAIRIQCEGTAGKLARKNAAYAKITQTVYSGPRKHFTFQDYINVHVESHNEIVDCDPREAIPEGKKVADFIGGITDPGLLTAIQVIYSDNTKMSNFDKCQKFLKTSLVNKKSMTAAPRRVIAQASTNHRGGGTTSGPNKLPKNFTLENKFYDKATYKLLSDEQREKLAKWAAKKKDNPSKRKIAALKKTWKKEYRISDDSNPSSEDEDNDQAGTQFGRGSHGKKKKIRKET